MKKFQNLTDYEKDIIYTGLCIRRNIIQTGSPDLSSEDVQNMGPEIAQKAYNAKIRPLTDEQMKLILKTNELIDDLLGLR